MFTNQASFPLLQRGSAVQDRLQVSNVLQKTGIEVNEKGTTAYAATQVSLTNKFGGDIEFIADRPFLFMIEDETTGTLIFSGKVTHPEYWKNRKKEEKSRIKRFHSRHVSMKFWHFIGA